MTLPGRLRRPRSFSQHLPAADLLTRFNNQTYGDGGMAVYPGGRIRPETPFGLGWPAGRLTCAHRPVTKPTLAAADRPSSPSIHAEVTSSMAAAAGDSEWKAAH